ncbi:MAG: mechanosensitive ion channel family protein [Acidobacteriota bacterium]
MLRVIVFVLCLFTALTTVPVELIATPAPATAAEPQEESLELISGNPFERMTWENFAEQCHREIREALPDLLLATLLMLVFYVIYQVVSRILCGILRRTQADPALQGIVGRLTKYAILGIGLVMAAGQIGLNIGSLLAGLGVAGLAVGLAAQETLSNLMAGITILWDRPFRSGDRVTIADTYGEVLEIGLRSTRLRTVQNRDAIFPNRDVINQKIINHTLSPELRLDIPIGIAYKEDTRRAREVLLAALEDFPRRHQRRPPEIAVVGLGDSAVDLELRLWLSDPHLERRAEIELVELAKIALDEAGIEIPFPQRTLHLGDDGVRDLLKAS